MPTVFRAPTNRLLQRVWLVMALFAALLIAVTSPALAHKDHKKKQAEATHVMQPGQSGAPAAMQGGPTAMHGQIGEMMEEQAEDRSKMTTFERLLDWLGRLHPMIVHFPIAFFPAALFTAIVSRRRPDFAAPVQFLVVAGGIIAPIAAVVGWLDAIGADPDPLLTAHRWLGTGIGVAAFGLGAWAWRKPQDDRGAGMIVGLSIITVAIVVQGWFGGAMVHGMDHMNW